MQREQAYAKSKLMEVLTRLFLSGKSSLSGTGLSYVVWTRILYGDVTEMLRLSRKEGCQCFQAYSLVIAEMGCRVRSSHK